MPSRCRTSLMVRTKWLDSIYPQAWTAICDPSSLVLPLLDIILSFLSLLSFSLVSLRYNVHTGNEKTCFVLKVHGSADAAATVVDTLSQRAMGLPGPVVDVLHMLLEFGHWLVLVRNGLQRETLSREEAYHLSCW